MYSFIHELMNIHQARPGESVEYGDEQTSTFPQRAQGVTGEKDEVTKHE